MFSGILDPLTIDRRPSNGHLYEIRVRTSRNLGTESCGDVGGFFLLEAIAYRRDDQEVASFLWNVHTDPLRLY